MSIYGLSFAGIAPSVKEDLSNEWEVSYEDEDKILQTVKTYNYGYPEDSELKFRYKYMISSNHSPDEEDVNLMALYLVVNPDDLCAKLKDSILCSTSGYCEYQDILTHGGASILLDSSVIHYKDEASTISLMQNVIGTIECLLGFYLDKPTNRLGTTGWDTIRYAVGLRENWF